MHSYDEAVDAKLDAIRKRDLDVRANNFTITPAQERTLEAERQYLNDAEIYVWTPHMIQLMTDAAKDFPSNTTLERHFVNSIAGWWWLGRNSPIMVRSWVSTPDIDGIDEYAERRGLHAVLFGNTGEGLYISGFTYDHFEPSGLIVPVTSTIWPFGQSLGEHLHYLHAEQSKRHDKTRTQRDAWSYSAMKVSKLFMVGSVLMGQKLLKFTDGHVTRGTRRRTERIKAQGRVNVVTLRRPEYIRKESEARQMEWDCQWVVRGHWRRQEHIEPGRAPIWINPHIKGPDDKPLKDPSRIFLIKE